MHEGRLTHIAPGGRFATIILCGSRCSDVVADLLSDNKNNTNNLSDFQEVYNQTIGTIETMNQFVLYCFHCLTFMKFIIKQ